MIAQRAANRQTWKALGLLTLLCVVNALRRNSDDFVHGMFGRALSQAALHTGTTLVLAVAVIAGVTLSYEHVPPKSRWHYAALAAAVLLSTLVGVAFILATDARFSPDSNPAWGWEDVITMWPRYAVIAMLLTGVYVLFRRAQQSIDDAHRANQDRLLMQQHVEEARLSVLQAQIEPHFLFNTLATVRRLYETDHAAAARMLDNLMRYLAMALPQMRLGYSTLAREIALTTAYLDIQRIRMGHRLTFSIDVENDLDEVDMPPMMLLTLAENAIKHGLAPLPEGGTLHIRARREHDRLKVEVIDSGRGFTPRAGGGTGLANIAARLAGTYGESAQLLLAPNRPHGVTATIALPLSNASHAAT